MNYYDLIYQIPAAVTASTAIAYMLPFRLPARFNPALLFLCALMVLSLATKIDIALAICGPISLIHNYLGVRLQGHEPMKIPWHRTLAYAQEFRDRMRKTEIREFLKRPYPIEPDPEPVAEDPEPVAEDPEPVAEDPEPVAEDPEPVAEDPEEEAVVVTSVRRFVPGL